MRINETYVVAQNSQVEFQLSHTPIEEQKVSMVVADGGVELVNGRDFVVQGKNVHYIATNVFFNLGESVVFKYFY